MLQNANCKKCGLKFQYLLQGNSFTASGYNKPPSYCGMCSCPYCKWWDTTVLHSHFDKLDIPECVRDGRDSYILVECCCGEVGNYESRPRWFYHKNYYYGKKYWDMVRKRNNQ